MAKRQADLLGGDAYPGGTAQQQENWELGSPSFSDLQLSMEPQTKEYNWFYGCNPAEAPIWMADLSFKEIGEIQVDDEIVGWTSDGSSERRKLARSKVQAVVVREANLVCVRFASGRSLRCTADHKWLQHWAKSRSMMKMEEKYVPPTIGEQLVHVIDPTSSLNPLIAKEAAWLGGIFDGEGCATSITSPRIAQCGGHNPEVRAEILRVLDLLGIEYSENRKDIWLKGGRQAIVNFANWTSPVKRQNLANAVLGERWQEKDEIISVEPAGCDKVFALTTTTENYIAWGYASKNSGQLHVSPIHSHDELRSHSGTPEDSTGPIAAGTVSVRGRRATWSAASNIALGGLKRVLEDYGKTVGWQWDGLTDPNGGLISDDFGARKSMWFRWNPQQEELGISERPLRDASGLIEITGKTARAIELETSLRQVAALKEWAQDFGYRLAEVPGGGNMMDKMKNWESLGDRDFGNPEADPEHLDEHEPEGEFDCPECGEHLPDFKAYQLHMHGHHVLTEEPVQDGHFPGVGTEDEVLPLRKRNVKPTAMPLASFHEASDVGAFKLHARSWDFDNDESKIFYGGYLGGKMVGYAVVRESEPEAEVMMVYTSVPGKGVGQTLMEKIQQQYPRLYSHAGTDEGQRLMERTGFVNTDHQLYRYAAGEEPKDMIQAPIPFIYDVQQDHITTGHPGMRTSDIMGHFTPAGIVEGYYEPGGKIVINTTTNMPYTVRHMLQLWYWMHPQMQITGVDLELQHGETQKLASADVGTYLRQLAATEPTVWNAYQALRKAGGKVYVVGGAVRDALLQHEPRDLDLMVAGLPPEEVNSVLHGLPGGVDLTGKRFGVYRYHNGGSEVEIALPRTDVYEESRRGKGQITVDHNLPVEHDLKRRDFTANSMAVDLDDGQLIDPYGGARDIDGHILRSTHDEAFREDPTRLIRALTAHSRFGLIPDEKTRQEMSASASALDFESPDALRSQLEKLMSSANPAGAMRLAQETGVLRHMFPELANNYDYDQNNPHHQYSLGDHSLHVLDNVSRVSTDPDLRLAGLLHDIGKPASAWVNPDTGSTHYYPGVVNGSPVGADHAAVGADMASNRLRQTFGWPVNRTERVNGLIGQHMFDNFSTPKGARKFLAKTGDLADDLLTLRAADQEGKGSPSEGVAKTPVDQMRSLVGEARQQGAPTDLSKLAINGSDLLALGIKPGPIMGQILQHLMQMVVEEPKLNNPTNLKQLAQEYAANAVA